MGARDREGDKTWDCYEDETLKGKCKCGDGYIYEVYSVASHEKVLRIERDYEGIRVKCPNPNCPSKSQGNVIK